MFDWAERRRIITRNAPPWFFTCLLLNGISHTSALITFLFFVISHVVISDPSGTLFDITHLTTTFSIGVMGSMVAMLVFGSWYVVLWGKMLQTAKSNNEDMAQLIDPV